MYESKNDFRSYLEQGLYLKHYRTPGAVDKAPRKRRHGVGTIGNGFAAKARYARKADPNNMNDGKGLSMMNPYSSSASRKAAIKMGKLTALDAKTGLGMVLSRPSEYISLVKDTAGYKPNGHTSTRIDYGKGALPVEQWAKKMERLKKKKPKAFQQEVRRQYKNLVD